jgi:cupin 2 domain-containing protein
MKKSNIFDIAELPVGNEEIFEILFQKKDIRIERIISNGQITPEGKWYEQQEDEFVFLLSGQASIEFEEGEISHLSHGDYLHIPALQKHRVVYTSSDPVCIWIAIHFTTTS